jgi:metal-dependent amidase/aminoacylase/carboxypeptidase family protein
VLSVTCLQAGYAYNVIPETAQIRGTARAFKREIMELMETNTRRLAMSVSAGYGANAEVDFAYCSRRWLTTRLKPTLVPTPPPRWWAPIMSAATARR